MELKDQVSQVFQDQVFGESYWPFGESYWPFGEAREDTSKMEFH